MYTWLESRKCEQCDLPAAVFFLTFNFCHDSLPSSPSSVTVMSASIRAVKASPGKVAKPLGQPRSGA